MILGEPNFFAYAALFIWVPIALGAFSLLRPPLAAMVTLLGGVLLLPESIAVDPPLVPPMDKFSMTALAALVGCMWKAPERLRAARPLRGIDALFLVVVGGTVGTVLTNGDPLVTGPVVRPALTLYDAFAHGVKDVLTLYLPFFLARAMLRTRRDLADLMHVLVASGLVYSVLALVEVRLSPQLHRWLYGYHQHEFSMTVRFGGYRPMIFLHTGMATAMFVLGTALAAWTRWRAGQSRPWIAAWLTAVLVICKSTGAIVYGAAAVPLVAWARRPRAAVAAALALMVLLYPALRGADIFPADTLVDAAGLINEERRLSLWFRFDQEDQLLERARERLVFGWGSYSRNRLFDPETGADLSVTDGNWIIEVGCRGLVGFLALYGMLVLPILLASRRMLRIRQGEDRVLLAGLALISALFTVDLLPNGLFNDLPFFFAGAVAGLADGLSRAAGRAGRR